jgi:hypothetical protein
MDKFEAYVLGFQACKVMHALWSLGAAFRSWRKTKFALHENDEMTLFLGKSNWEHYSWIIRYWPRSRRWQFNGCRSNTWIPWSWADGWVRRLLCWPIYVWDRVWRNQPIKSALRENYAPRDGVTLSQVRQSTARNYSYEQQWRLEKLGLNEYKSRCKQRLYGEVQHPVSLLVL